jgi:hypothetical protein
MSSGRVDPQTAPSPPTVPGGRIYSRELLELGIPPGMDMKDICAGYSIVEDSLLPLDENLSETRDALYLVRNCRVDGGSGDRIGYDMPNGGWMNIDPERVLTDMDLETYLQGRLDSLRSLWDEHASCILEHLRECLSRSGIETTFLASTVTGPKSTEEFPLRTRIGCSLGCSKSAGAPSVRLLA